MGQTVRAFLADVPFIHRVSQEAGLPWKAQDYWEDMQQEQAIYMVNSAGFIGGRILLDEAEITNIAVLKSQRHKGYAKDLWNAFKVELIGQNVKVCFLEVRESNVDARQFYEALGFVEIGKRKTYYRNPVEDAWIYRWENV